MSNKDYVEVHFNKIGGPDYKRHLETIIEKLIVGPEEPQMVLTYCMQTILDLDEAAAQWELCSCGSLCAAIPRLKYHMAHSIDVSVNANRPMDQFLANKGVEFHELLAGAAELSLQIVNDEDANDEYNWNDTCTEAIMVQRKAYNEYAGKPLTADDIEKDENKHFKVLFLLQAALQTHLEIELRAKEILESMFPTQQDWELYVQSVESNPSNN